MRIIKNLLWTILLSLVLVLATFIHNAIEDFRHPTCNLQGRVVKLADGDSITVLDEDEVQYKIRLAGIDTPERGQAFGKAAKTFLSEKIANKTVCIGWSKKDRYQRLVGVVRLGDEDINLSIVKAGLAWHYKAYQSEQTSTDQRAYAKAETQARKKRLGLWKDKAPVAPWDWRRNQRQ